MNRKLIFQCIVLAFAFTIPPITQAAETRYITDEFEVTMRSGTSTANNIVRLLVSGEKVSVLEEDLASKYSLVESADGKKGYILNRYLINIPSARERLERLNKSAAAQKEKIKILNDQLKSLQNELQQEQSDNKSLKGTLLASENELSDVRDAASNTLSIQDDNQHLQEIVIDLKKGMQLVNDENADLKDTTQIDAAVKGAAFFFLAFLSGIIVTRIRWRKNDSWGSGSY